MDPNILKLLITFSSMNVNLKKIVSSKILLKDLKLWISWLNDKLVTRYSNQRFYKHTIYSQKIL